MMYHYWIKKINAFSDQHLEPYVILLKVGPYDRMCVKDDEISHLSSLSCCRPIHDLYLINKKCEVDGRNGI